MAKIISQDINQEKLVNQYQIPKPDSHKNQNGKLLVIGGSSLFHAASIWACEIASHFVDLVHYSSTIENSKVFINLKTKFTNGIVIARKDLEYYAEEDDCILIGPGMLRSEKYTENIKNITFKKILALKDEGQFTHSLTHYLLKKYKSKRFVIDAGALQMLNPSYLTQLTHKAILTPQNAEFKRIFGIDISLKPLIDKVTHIKKTAKKFHCIILYKSRQDIMTDGENVFIIKGGNAGLTKGGTGDLLAGMTASLYTKNNPLLSCLLASYCVKQTADELVKRKGMYYNIDDIKNLIPEVFNKYLQKRGLTI